MVLTKSKFKCSMRRVAVVSLQLLYMQFVFGATAFVFVSAHYAWTEKQFDLGDATLIALCGSFFPYAMLLTSKLTWGIPVFYAKPKKLIEKEKKLAEKWERLKEEASQMKAMHRLDNED